MNHESNKFALEANRHHKRQRVGDDEPQAYAGADENSSDSDGENDTYGDDESDPRNTGTFADIVGPDGQILHLNYPKDKGNRKRIPAPMWLQAGGPKRHSDVQLQSGENLSNLKRKYKQSLCLYCAEFNRKSPWATTRSRKYEHEIFNKHEKSKHHQQALSELNKSSFGIAENGNTDAAVFVDTTEFNMNNVNAGIKNSASLSAGMVAIPDSVNVGVGVGVGGLLSSNFNMGILHNNHMQTNTPSIVANINNNNHHLITSNIISNSNIAMNAIMANKNRITHCTVATNTTPVTTPSNTNDINNNNSTNDNNTNNSSAINAMIRQQSNDNLYQSGVADYGGDDPAHEHALMLAAIATGCPPNLRPQISPSSGIVNNGNTANDSITNLFMKKTKNARTTIDAYPYEVSNTYSQLHDFDHENYDGSEMMRNNNIAIGIAHSSGSVEDRNENGSEEKRGNEREGDASDNKVGNVQSNIDADTTDNTNNSNNNNNSNTDNCTDGNSNNNDNGAGFTYDSMGNTKTTGNITHTSNNTTNNFTNTNNNNNNSSSGSDTLSNAFPAASNTQNQNFNTYYQGDGGACNFDTNAKRGNKNELPRHKVNDERSSGSGNRMINEIRSVNEFHLIPSDGRSQQQQANTPPLPYPALSNNMPVVRGNGEHERDRERGDGRERENDNEYNNSSSPMNNYRTKQDTKASKNNVPPPDWCVVSGDMVHSDALLSSDRDLEGVPKKHRLQFCLLCAEFSPRSPWASLKSRKFDPDTWDEHTHSLSHTAAVIAKEHHVCDTSDHSNCVVRQTTV